MLNNKRNSPVLARLCLGVVHLRVNRKLSNYISDNIKYEIRNITNTYWKGNIPLVIFCSEAEISILNNKRIS